MQARPDTTCAEVVYKGARKLIGRRVYDLGPHEYESGDYGLYEGNWFCRAPGGEGRQRFTGNLSNHEVVEHEDGAITVSPSILVSSRWAGVEYSWHGYLRNGEWSEC